MSLAEVAIIVALIFAIGYPIVCNRKQIWRIWDLQDLDNQGFPLRIGFQSWELGPGAVHRQLTGPHLADRRLSGQIQAPTGPPSPVLCDLQQK